MSAKAKATVVAFPLFPEHPGERGGKPRTLIQHGCPIEAAEALLPYLDASEASTRATVAGAFKEEYGDAGFSSWDAWVAKGTDYPGDEASRAEWNRTRVRNWDRPSYPTGLQLISQHVKFKTNAPPSVSAPAYDTTTRRPHERVMAQLAVSANRGSSTAFAPTTHAPQVAVPAPAAAAPQAARPPVPDFPYALAGEFVKGPPMSWLVKGVIPKAELGMIYGASGSGKSFFAGDLAVHMAAGLEWRGRRTKRVRVAYIAAEGAVGFKSRLRATAAHLGVKLADLQLGVFNCAPNFTDDAQAAKLKEQLTAIKPDVVFVDTLARVAAGADENSGKDMGKVLDHCKAIREATGALVIIIHHSGKNAALGARGWSGIKAACDLEIEVSRAGPTARVAALSKVKDGPDGEDFGFQLVPVEVVDEDGQRVKDEDGEQVWSCYVAPVAGEAIPKPQAERPQPKGPTEEAVQEALIDLLPTATGRAGVPRKALIEAAAEKLSPSTKLATRKWSAGRSLDSMAKRGVVVAEGGRDGTVRLP